MNLPCEAWESQISMTVKAPLSAVPAEWLRHPPDEQAEHPSEGDPDPALN